MNRSSKDEIVSLSAGWIAVVLNIFPGLGTGYIYQRRWKAYWATVGLSFLWTIFIVLREFAIDPSDPLLSQQDQLGLVGIMILSFLTALESGLYVKSIRTLDPN